MIVTEWDEFRGIDPRRMASRMRGDVVDLRNVYDRAEADEASLRYFPIGRGTTGKTMLERNSSK